MAKKEGTDSSTGHKVVAAAAQEGKGAGALPGNASLLPPSPTRDFPRKRACSCARSGPHPIALCPPPCSPWQEGLSGYPQRQCWSCMDWGTRELVTAASRTSLVWGYAAHVGKGDEWKGTLVTPTFRQGTCQKVVHADRESDFCGLDALQARGGPGFLLLSMLGSRRARPPC